MRPGEHAPESTNVINFQRPLSARPPMMQAGPGIMAGRDLPFDTGALRRPVAVTAMASPTVMERDALAHDARNTMASLELISDLLAEPGVLAPEHKHFAHELRAVADTASTLISRMARTGAQQGEPVFAREPLRPALPRRTASTAPLQWEGIDAGTMVEDCTHLLAAVAGPRVRVRVNRDQAQGVPVLEAEDMTRVLMNLVRNASEAMPEGGDVLVTVRQGARFGMRSMVVIMVKDNGPGIPVHALGQIFQAGFTSKSKGIAWPSADHYGLGLAIVRELVEACGGSVRVTSALGKGTTFELRLPCR